jgi:hypothetical protein
LRGKSFFFHYGGFNIGHSSNLYPWTHMSIA